MMWLMSARGELAPSLSAVFNAKPMRLLPPRMGHHRGPLFTLRFEKQNHHPRPTLDSRVLYTPTTSSADDF